mgnify:CR=1 FL=1
MLSNQSVRIKSYMSFNLQAVNLEYDICENAPKNNEDEDDECIDGKVYDHVAYECVPATNAYITPYNHCYSRDTIATLVNSDENLRTFSNTPDAGGPKEWIRDPLTTNIWGRQSDLKAAFPLPGNTPSAPPMPAEVNSPTSPASPAKGMTVQTPRPALILFHAEAWCGPCIRFMPVWDEVCGCHHDDPYSLFNVFEYDCSKSGAFEAETKHYNVRGYPTLIWQSAGDGADAKWNKYEGERTKESIMQYVYTKLGNMWDKPPRNQKVLLMGNNVSIGEIQNHLRKGRAVYDTRSGR